MYYMMFYSHFWRLGRAWRMPKPRCSAACRLAMSTARRSKERGRLRSKPLDALSWQRKT